MNRTTIPLELILADLHFREGDEGGDTGGDNKGGDSKDGGDGGKKDDEDEDILTDSKGRQISVSGLKAALATERKNREKLEKDEKARTKATEEAALKEQGEIATLKAAAEKAQEKAERLAKGYYRRNLDDAIREEARTQKFIDVTDALSGVDRALISAEQDDDEPDKVVVDLTSVKKAVKALADSKKHLIKTGTDDGEATGSSFGGSGKSNEKKGSRNDELKALYPGL